MLKPQVVQAIPNVESFLRHCQRKDYKAKSVIVREGESSESLYLILDGSVSVMGGRRERAASAVGIDDPSVQTEGCESIKLGDVVWPSGRQTHT